MNAELCILWDLLSFLQNCDFFSFLKLVITVMSHLIILASILHCNFIHVCCRLLPFQIIGEATFVQYSTRFEQIVLVMFRISFYISNLLASVLRSGYQLERRDQGEIWGIHKVAEHHRIPETSIFLPLNAETCNVGPSVDASTGTWIQVLKETQ